MVAHNAEQLRILIKTDHAALVSEAISERLTGIDCDETGKEGEWVELVITAVPAHLALAERMLMNTVLSSLPSADFSVHPDGSLEEFSKESVIPKEREVWKRLHTMQFGLDLERHIVPGIHEYIESESDKAVADRRKRTNLIRKVGREVVLLVTTLNESAIHYKGIPVEVLKLLMNPIYKKYSHVMNAIPQLNESGRNYADFIPHRNNLSDHIFEKMREVLAYLVVDLELGD